MYLDRGAGRAADARPALAVGVALVGGTPAELAGGVGEGTLYFEAAFVTFLHDRGH